MTLHSLNIEHQGNYNILGIINELKKHEDEHGALFLVLFNAALFFSVLVLIFINPPKFFLEIISRLFNLPFKVKGAVFYVYNLVAGFIVFLGVLLLVFKLQTEQFTKNQNLDTPEKRLYRLKYKWIGEEQLWLLTMIFVEVIAIYRFSTLYDEEKEMENKISSKENVPLQIENEENIQNINTQTSYNDN